MPRYEADYYDSIGQWLISQKGCERNDYFKGYAKDTLLVRDKRVDVFGLQYTLHEYNSSSSHFDFNGYAIEMKCEVSDLIYDIQKIKDEYIASIQNREDPWRSGLNQISFYVAFNGTETPHDILSKCTMEGIGVLRIVENSDGEIIIHEDLEPNPYELHRLSNRSQRSIGTFSSAIEAKGYFRSTINNPEDVFNAYLRPRMNQYNADGALSRAIDYNSDIEARGLLKYLLKEIRLFQPDIAMNARGERYNENIILITKRDGGDPLLQIRVKRNNFSIDDKINQKSYRVTSEDDIIEFSNEPGVNRQYPYSFTELVKDEVLTVLR